ncbi:dihydropteroate synthase [Maritimibacter dapengensis]|uniref:Dihydropteroate synthase n=1 Tax=Maritimibacter dapengensis TaxID=2836868 RepID=A0ABS6T005_9RHOB|nr:dihydropteroate synthase [Maritimibacter dapengensis]MBV7377926.1 dihydropteroate synthase [Maritimibacter dapengensis]
MSRWAEATPGTGHRPAGARMLAGMSGLWFDTVHGPDDETTLARISEPRPDLCGLTLDRPRVMGILNVTPDSFSDGGDHSDLGVAVARARIMSGECDIIDIGGESTRPGAGEVPAAEEIARVVPVIAAIREAGISTPISIDTRKARVADAALDAGANMVNDVSAFEFDPELADLCAERDVSVCLMHAKGLPETMQIRPTYEDVVGEVMDHLMARIAFATSRGVRRERIVTDPGIGFGKTLDHNLTLLRHLTVFHDLGLPVLLGASRKRFIGVIGDAEAAKDRLGGSLAVALYGAARGMHILRVHDTKETSQALKLARALQGD